MEKIKSAIGFQKLTIPRIAILGLLLALLISLKYAFGFIAGVELISFFFIFLGIFLPIFDLMILIFSFNMIVAVMYGFGTWWIMYWIIWPLDSFISKLISKFTKNKYIFAGWGLIAGFSVFIWYFISDLIFFGSNYAFLNIISAIPINAIEGLTTMIACIVFAPRLSIVFNRYRESFWPEIKEWSFKNVKYKKTHSVLTIFILMCAIVGIVLLFLYNGWFLDLKDSLIGHNQSFLRGGSGYEIDK